MARLSIVAAPTFKAKVAIPVAGAEPVEVEFTFKHRTKAGLQEFVESRAGKSDAETLLDMVTGWEFEEELNESNAKTMLQNYIAAPVAIYQAYVNELVLAKAKN